MKRGVDVGRVRQLNRRLVLRCLRTDGRATRAELVKVTGLTHATVSAIVADLVAEGWVCERGVETIPRGRPPILLEIDAERHCVAGIQIGPERTRVTVVDALGRVLTRYDGATRARTARAVARRAARFLRQTLNAGGLDWRQIHAVGVSVPGAVEPGTGVVTEIPEFGWKREPLRKLLADDLGVGVHVFDEIYVMACLELLEGVARDARDAVVLSVSVEPSATLIIDGKVHRGSGGYAGSIAHVSLPGLHATCRCGRLGCLRTVVSREAIAERATQLARSGSGDIDRGRARDLPGLALIEAAAEGRAGAVEVVNEAAGYLAQAASFVVNLVDPDTLILGAGLAGLGEPLLGPFRERILRGCQPHVAEKLRFVESAFRGPERARAAALVTLHEAHEHLDSLFHDSDRSAVA